MNSRGESFTRTLDGLRQAGYATVAEEFASVSSDKQAWEKWARDTFEAHVTACPTNKLRFLQYVNADNKDWWAARQKDGAVLL